MYCQDKTGKQSIHKIFAKGVLIVIHTTLREKSEVLQCGVLVTGASHNQRDLPTKGKQFVAKPLASYRGSNLHMKGTARSSQQMRNITHALVLLGHCYVFLSTMLSERVAC